MTGPEHYLTAERLLNAARSPKGRAEEDMATIHAAQVHATLALAAATALRDGGDNCMYQRDWDGWVEAASARKANTP